tara:strand:- start:303 stop:2000 length:1698 start_codon:yes stop_codon:yes gene_type:complete
MFKNSAAFQRVMSRVGKKVIDKFDDFMNKEDGKVAFNESGLTSSPRLKDFRDDPSKKFLPGESTKLEVKDAAPITFNKTNLRQFYNKEIRPLLNEKGITSAEKKSRGQLNDVMQKFFNLKGVYSTNASKKLTSLFDSKSFYDLTPTVKSKTPLRNIQKELAKIKSLDQFLRKTSLDKIKTDTRVKNIVKELRKQRGATDLTVNLGDVKKYALDSIARLSDEENLLKKDLVRTPRQLDILGEVTGPEGSPFPIIPKKSVTKPKDTFLQRAKELDDPKFIEEFEQLQKEIPDEPIGTTTGRSGKRFRIDEEGRLTSEIDPKVRAEMERVQQQQSRTPFFEQDYIDEGVSEFANPEGRGYTVKGAETAFYNRLKQLDPGFIDSSGKVSGMQPKTLNVKLVDDYTKEQLLNLPDEERELLNRAMNIYVDAVDDIKTRRPGVNDADADAFARDVVNSTLLDEGARPSIVKTGDRFYEPEKKLLRKYKSSLKAFKPLRREIPEDDLIGVKEVDAIQLPIKFKKKGGLLGLLKRKKKKFVPKIIKNKKLKKRTQQKPRGVGKALRGYGATSG